MVFARRRLAGNRDAALVADILIHMVHFLPVESIVRGVLHVCKRWSSISKSPSAWSHLHIGHDRAWTAQDICALVSRAGNHLVEFSSSVSLSSVWAQVMAAGSQPRLRKITLLWKRPGSLAEELKPLLQLQNGGFREIYAPCSSCGTLARFQPTLTVREEDATIRTIPCSYPCHVCEYDWCFICCSKCVRPLRACLCKLRIGGTCPIVYCDCWKTRDPLRVSLPILEL